MIAPGDSTKTLAESDLLRQAWAGDRRAFGRIVRLHERRVRLFVGRFLRDPGQIDDVAQEVFISAFRRLSSFRGDAPLSSWLLGIARLQVLLHVRGDRRWHQRAKSALEDALTEADIRELTASEEGLDRRVSLEALQRCLERLAPTSARVVRQHYFAGVPLTELATQLGRREGAVRVMLFRIRQALRDCVNGEALG